MILGLERDWLKRIQRSIFGSRFVKNSFWSVFGSGLARVLNLLAMIFLAKVLTIQEYGTIGLIQATIGMLGVFSGVSLGTTATKFVAQNCTSNPLELGKQLFTVWIVGTFLAVAVSILLIMNAESFSQSISGEISQNHRVISGLCSVFVSALVLRSIQEGVLSGFGEFKMVSFLKVLEGVLIAIFTPALGYYTGVGGALLGLTLSTLFVFFCGAIAVTSSLKTHGVKLDHRVSFKDIGFLTHFTLPTFLANTLGTPIVWVGLAILKSNGSGLQSVGIYSAAYQWYGPLIFIPLAINRVALPKLSQLVRDPNCAPARNFLLNISVVMLGFTLSMALFLSMLSEEIFRFYGSEYESAVSVMVVLVFTTPLHALSNFYMAALQAMEMAWQTFYTIIAWAIIFLLCAVFLVSKFDALGLAIAMFASYFALAMLRLLIVIKASSKFEVKS